MESHQPRRWTRAGALGSLDRDFDVAVIGGGVIGAAVALDAAARGLAVVLFEQDDFASGTSSKSTKLLHGGIRYLPHFQFGLIREGLGEQRILAKTADHLFRPLQFVLPLYRGRGMADLPRWASSPRLLPYTMRIGLTLYDLLGRRDDDARHRRLATAEVQRLAPTLRTEGLRGGFAYGDAQTDDARLTMAVLKTAVQRYDAVAVSGVHVAGVTRVGPGFALRAIDMDSSEEIKVSARSVISATWAFRPPELADHVPTPPTRLSKGVHLLYRAEDLGLGDSAIVLPETDDDRVLFVVPWQGMALVGTTDTPYHGDPSAVVADAEDVEYLVSHVHRYLDVPDAEPIASFAGLRALVDDGESTAQASRGHTMVEVVPGYTQVMGGKLTAYRPIAAEAVDTLRSHLGIEADSPTATEVLVGAGTTPAEQASIAKRLSQLGFEGNYAAALHRRYGTAATLVVDILERDNLEGDESTRRTIGDGTITVAEVIYTARYEAARSVADFALRRTHLSWSVRDHGRADASVIADALGDENEWTDERRRHAVEAFDAELLKVGL